MSDDGVFLLFDANVIGLETNGDSITGVQIVDSDGNRRHVRARRYILATGGIENSRLLLWSNVQTNGQLVKDANALGRYWLEHPHFTLGEAIVTGNLPFVTDDWIRFFNNDRNIAFFAPTPDTIVKEGILNCGLRFNRVSYGGANKIVADIACVAPDWGVISTGRRNTLS